MSDANDSSAELHSAVSRILNPPGRRNSKALGAEDAQPNAIRQYGRLQICATARCAPALNSEMK
jgi:hypothetical protein